MTNSAAGGRVAGGSGTGGGGPEHMLSHTTFSSLTTSKRDSRQVATKTNEECYIPLLEGGSFAGRGFAAADPSPCKRAQRKVAKEHPGAMESQIRSKKTWRMSFSAAGGWVAADGPEDEGQQFWLHGVHYAVRAPLTLI